VTRRLEVVLPTSAPFAGRGGRPIRLLAVSDEPDEALDDGRNRAELGPIDGVLGCGDLEADYLAFLGDAFGVPLLGIRGNHDRGSAWEAASRHAPAVLGSGELGSIEGLTVGGLGWPGRATGSAVHDELGAGADSLRLGRRWLARRLRRAHVPTVIVSHAPPRGLGDRASDDFHRGFRAYRWLLELVRPSLWVHGHVTPASVTDLIVRHGPTTVVNATGSILIELRPPREPASDRRRP
jgi:hypothetical protein